MQELALLQRLNVLLGRTEHDIPSGESADGHLRAIVPCGPRIGFVELLENGSVIVNRKQLFAYRRYMQSIGQEIPETKSLQDGRFIISPQNKKENGGPW
jgi:hypothetical protein